jgi:hypothetical protein
MTTEAQFEFFLSLYEEEERTAQEIASLHLQDRVYAPSRQVSHRASHRP